MRNTLTGTVVSCEDLTSSERYHMFELFEGYYNAVDRQTFDQDLLEKHWALLLRDADGSIRGFTTMMSYDLVHHERSVRAIFNGNTIIHRSFWGEQELTRTWCRFMATLKLEQPTIPLYWYLICSGFRTYLFLPLFFRSFVPGCNDNGTPFERSLRDHLGRLKFPDEFANSVVHVHQPRECLHPELAVPSPARLRSPHVRFFVEHNPGYLLGDELVCLAEYSLANTRRTAHSALASRLPLDPAKATRRAC